MMMNSCRQGENMEARNKAEGKSWFKKKLPESFRNVL
jgi:hypothetical protein